MKSFRIIVLCIFIIVFNISITFCSNENNNEEIWDNTLEPPELGVIGKKYDDKDAFEKERYQNVYIASLGGSINEVYPLNQFTEDAKILIISNMSPEDALLKIDNPTVISNFVWDIVSAKLLFKMALKEFKIFDDDYKEYTMKIYEEEAKTQYMILNEINIPIKTYEPTNKDKATFYSERKDVFEKMGIESYEEIIDLKTEYRRHYTQKTNEKFINMLAAKYKYELKEEILDKIKEMFYIDEIMNSEHSKETILILNNKTFTTEDFARFLLIQLTTINAKSMRNETLFDSTTPLDMEIDTIIQKFIRHNLLLEEFKTKTYNENNLKRFTNLYIETRIAELFIRKEVDSTVPPPMPFEVEKYYKSKEYSVKNYFWTYYADMGASMGPEEMEDYVKNVIAEMILHDELIREEQKRFRRYILWENDYKTNEELIKTKIIKKIPLDKKYGKNPLSFFK